MPRRPNATINWMIGADDADEARPRVAAAKGTQIFGAEEEAGHPTEAAHAEHQQAPDDRHDREQNEDDGQKRNAARSLLNHGGFPFGCLCNGCTVVDDWLSAGQRCCKYTAQRSSCATTIQAPCAMIGTLFLHTKHLEGARHESNRTLGVTFYRQHQQGTHRPAAGIRTQRTGSRCQPRSGTCEGLCRTLRHPQGARQLRSLLADPEVDAIYLSLPNGMHAEWAVKAAQAGKHVLCEKPLVVSPAEFDRVEAAARRQRRDNLRGVHVSASPADAPGAGHGAHGPPGQAPVDQQLVQFLPAARTRRECAAQRRPHRWLGLGCGRLPQQPGNHGGGRGRAGRGVGAADRG